MSKAPITVKSRPVPLAKTPAEQAIEDQRMQDILVLLESLSLREEVTIKLILDCLYDIGSVNLINKKFQDPPLNGILKYISRFTKPVFRVVAWRWFLKNCPKLITNWLQKKVTF